ncbi:DUF3048 domain-containing protein [Clostridium paraputrificum]|uniref:DUF3048 domain-containing protein n=1 Tax=Clostridium paraputrificum TaxID=29363 RepID=UPI00325C0EDD
MKKRLAIIIITTLLGSCLYGCNKKEAVNTTNVVETKYSFPYTGEECDQTSINNTPFMVMVENSPAARPQSGLSQADIIYETSAEGGIPRFMALFHSQSPSTIGPVRSVRPYYITLSRENSLPFAHCGGSLDALNEIKQDNSIMSINEISKEHYFWRDSTRKAPHNLYTSSEKIRSFISTTDWNVKPKNFSNFDNEYYKKDDYKACDDISITINNHYNTSYTYNNNVYTKYMDDEKAWDMAYESPLEFSNVIIQKTDINLAEDGLHLDINLIGEGDGLLLSNGKILDIKWRKYSELSETKLYDMNGNELPLSAGKTIWHIVDNKTSIKY